MFAVAVKCRPLTLGNPRFSVRITPVISNAVPGVADDQLPSFVTTGKADYQRTELRLGTGGVYVRLEEAGGSRVKLAKVSWGFPLLKGRVMELEY